MQRPTYHHTGPDGTKRLKHLFNVQLEFMQWIGELPPRLQHKLQPYLGRRAAAWLANTYSAFSVFQSLHLSLLFIWTVAGKSLQHAELEEITDAVTMVIIYSFSTFATCYWIWNGRKLLDYVAAIDGHYRQHSLLASRIVGMRSSYERALRVTIIWQLACGLGVTLWGIAPFILGVRALPLHCWYPFDELAPGWYEALYAIQLHSQVNMGSTFGTSGSLLVSLIIILLSQFDVLYCSLKHLPEHAVIRAAAARQDRRVASETVWQNQLEEMPLEGLVGEVQPEQDEAGQYLFLLEQKPQRSEQQLTALAANWRQLRLQPSPALKRALHESLVDCVQHHQFLLQCCAQLEELFSPYCLIKSLQITLQLCLLVFVAVEGTTSVVGVLNLVQYLALTFTELLIFTLCGELLRSHSVRSAEALCRSPWWTYAKWIRRDMLIFMTNSRRSLRLTAGKFYTMDVERLRSVVAQAISFLTLLQKLAEKRPD